MVPFGKNSLRPTMMARVALRSTRQQPPNSYAVRGVTTADLVHLWRSDMRYDVSRPPAAHHACIVCSPRLHKRAALLFDRIFVPSGDFLELEIPTELTFGHDCGVDHPDWTLWLTYGLNVYSRTGKGMLGFDRFVSDMYRRRGFDVIAGYTTVDAFRSDFERLPTEDVYHAVLENIPLLSTETEWAQIMEFRNDAGAREKVRRLANWLRTGVQAKSTAHAQDLIGQMVTDYAKALHKHDLRTMAGGLTLVISATGIAVGAATGALPALFAGLTIAGATTAWLLKQRCDRDDVERGKNSEIAIVYEARTRLPMAHSESTSTR